MTCDSVFPMTSIWVGQPSILRVNTLQNKDHQGSRVRYVYIYIIIYIYITINIWIYIYIYRVIYVSNDIHKDSLSFCLLLLCKISFVNKFEIELKKELEKNQPFRALSTTCPIIPPEGLGQAREEPPAKVYQVFSSLVRPNPRQKKV